MGAFRPHLDGHIARRIPVAAAVAIAVYITTASFPLTVGAVAVTGLVMELFPHVP